MKPILEIKNISKKFRILHNRQPYLSLRDSLISVFKSGNSSYEEFYALNEVCFNVNPGESLGIIGKNGAGKSTLLKILSKITPPSSGNIISRGRIASLLEVGTGFHPELSGRENVFLNGSILGMKQKEIKAKFDEIVDFSGTEKFLDTPLKHFSSGMQLRLAFSVAAFLEPEILVIDEVLAVGDAEFQKKCMGKMEDVSKEGRTILFVSHNMGAVASLCSRAIILDNGKVVADTNSGEAIHLYHQRQLKKSDDKLNERRDRKGNNSFKFRDYTIKDGSGKKRNVIISGDTIKFSVTIEATKPDTKTEAYLTLVIKDSVGIRVVSLASGFYNKTFALGNETEIEWTWKDCPLTQDEYFCTLVLYEGGIADGGTVLDLVEDAFSFKVEAGDYFGKGIVPVVKKDKFFSGFEIEKLR